MLFRRLAVLFALICAGLASQVPEFAQQYRQRIGGAVDELQRILADFDQDAASGGLDRRSGVVRLQSNPDPFVQGRGTQIQRIADREQRLRRQAQSMDEAGSLGRVFALMRDFDPQVATQAAGDFSPAVPITVDGFVSALIGFGLGLALVHGVALPLRRRRRRTMREAPEAT